MDGEMASDGWPPQRRRKENQAQEGDTHWRVHTSAHASPLPFDWRTGGPFSLKPPLARHFFALFPRARYSRHRLGPAFTQTLRLK
jgi:hypothetical protein